MTAFEDKVNAELPRRPATLKVAAVGYDGDPNSGSAPDTVKNAPGGTFYLQETPDRLWRKTSTPLVWVENEGDIVSPATKTDITVEIDPASAVPAPDAGVVFDSQSQVDAYLTAHSGTAFKHIRDYIDTLPRIISHVVILNLVAGIHRPSANHGIIVLARTRVDPGELIFQGVPVAEYDSVHSGGTIRSHQTLDEITGVADPYVICDPDTFPDDNSLSGRFAVFSNGFYGIIWKHDDQQLWIVKKLGPVPVDDSTTVAVKQPASVLQNSSNGTTRATVLPISFDLGHTSNTGAYGTELNDLIFEDFGADIPIWCRNSRYHLNRFILDKIAGPPAEFGFGFRFYPAATVDMRNCSCIGTPVAMGILEVVESWCRAYYCYFQGGSSGSVTVNGSGADFWLWHSVVRNVDGYAPWYGAINVFRGSLNFQNVSGGVINTIADTVSALPGMFLYYDSFLVHSMRFLNVVGPCFRLAENAGLDYLDWFPDLVATGCGDVGYSMLGPSARLRIDSYSEISGSGGDVRFEDSASAFTYAELLAAGVVTDSILNLVRR